MDFIKQMKKREFIEMGLKALASLFAVFLAIILLEGMIYGIKLNALDENEGKYSTHEATTVAYCIEEDEDSYLVLFHMEDVDHWSSAVKPKNEVTKENLMVNKIVLKAPSAFTFSVEGWHFIVFGVLFAAVGGYFAYRFVRLNQSYKKIEAQFLKDGTIEITNV